MTSIIIYFLLLVFSVLFMFYLYEARFEKVSVVKKMKGEVLSKSHSLSHQVMFTDPIAGHIEAPESIYEVLIQSGSEIYEAEGLELFQKVEENDKVSFDVEFIYKKLKNSKEKRLIKRRVISIKKS